MPPSHQFEYLPLVLRESGLARFPPAPRDEDPTTVINRANRATHAGTLTARTSALSTSWKAARAARQQAGLPEIEEGIPLVLKIDTALELDDLRRQFEFEIVSEQEDGYVIVASRDVDLTDFQKKLTDYVSAVTGSAMSRRSTSCVRTLPRKSVWR